MAGMSEFFTRFNIGAVFTGQKGFDQATKAVLGTEKAAQKVNVGFGSMVRGIAGSQVVIRGATAAFNAVNLGLWASFDAAKEAAAVYENLGKSVDKNAARWQLTAEATAKYKETIKATAAEQEKTGHDAEVLAAGYTKIQEAIKPEQFAQLAPVFSDILTYTKSVNATMADSTDVANTFVDSIVGGRPAILTMIDATEEQKKAFTKTNDQAERFNIFMEAAAKHAGETTRAFGTAPGQLAQLGTQMGNLAETIGGPFVQAAVAVTPAFREIALALAPVAEAFASKLTPAAERFAAGIQANMPIITNLFTTLGNVLVWLVDHWYVAAAGATALGVAFAVMLGPIGIILASLTALGAAALVIAANWDALVESFKKTEIGASIMQGIEAITPQVATVMDSLGATMKEVWANTLKEFEAVSAFLGPIISDLVTNTITEFQQIGTVLSSVWTGVKSGFEQIGAAIQAIAPYVQQAFANWATAATWVNTEVIQPIITAFGQLVEGVKLAISGDIQGAFSTWIGAVDYVRTEVVDAIVQLFTGMAGKVGSALSGVAGVIKGAFSGAISAVMGMIDSLIGKWNSLKAAIAAGVGKITGGAIGTAPTPAAAQTVPGAQMGGLIANPTIAALAEKGIPEMVIPLQGTERSRGLLSQAAGMIGAKPGAAGPMSISMSPSIVINGAPAGQEGAIGKEVQRALEDPIKTLLDQIRAARNYEARLGYV